MSKKNYPKLVIKVIYVNLRPARKYQERTPLLFFLRLRSIMTIPFHSLTSRSTLESMSASEQLRTNPSTVLPNNSQIVTSWG